MGRVSGGLLAACAALLIAVPQAQAQAQALDTPRTPTQCAVALDCPIDEINLMSMDDRLAFVREMQRIQGPKFGAQSRWRNIEGVITFFRDHRWGAPGTWVSYVDAGIVEGIERGLALALDRPGGDFGNPGSKAWESYVRKLAAGQLRDRGRHDRAWGVAEQAATDHGVYIAEVVHRIPPSWIEKNFYDFSQLYRTIMRNKPEAAEVVEVFGIYAGQPEVTFRSRDFVDWFTDVGNIVPSRKGCEMAYLFAKLDIFGGIGGAIDLFLTFIPDMFDQYLAELQAAQRGSAAPAATQRQTQTLAPRTGAVLSPPTIPKRSAAKTRARARFKRPYRPRRGVKIPRSVLRTAAPGLAR